LHNAGELNEAALFGFAKAHKYEESVVALSAMSAVKIATLDRLIAGDRHDPILIVGKAVGSRMGHRARPDPASARSQPGAGSRGHRRRAREFRTPDAFDRGAGSDFLANPSIGVMLSDVQQAPWQSNNRMSFRGARQREPGISRFPDAQSHI